MEYAPYGSRGIRMTASEKRSMRRKIIKGGQIADQIRKMAKDHHTDHELPVAEREIEKKLAQTHKDQVAPENTKKKSLMRQKKKMTFWQKIPSALKRLFLP